MASRRPKRPQDGQEDSERACWDGFSPVRASVSSRRLERPPRWPHDGPRGPQDSPRALQDGLKTAHQGPWTAQ
eukprot:7614102-Pyramimonas_sp.AAC.1